MYFNILARTVGIGKLLPRMQRDITFVKALRLQSY